MKPHRIAGLLVALAFLPVGPVFAQEAKDGPEYLFISFDIDVLDPAYTPGTGTPEPGGLTPREAFPLIRRLCAETNVVGMELVEVAPTLDPSYTTDPMFDQDHEALVLLHGLDRGQAAVGPKEASPQSVTLGRRRQGIALRWA